uniref:Uncharacterized protein n=1 Tax=Myotis lucifugus TaxID=59463 RepID=G1Q0A3_MYOLU
ALGAGVRDRLAERGRLGTGRAMCLIYFKGDVASMLCSGWRWGSSSCS